MSIITKTGDGGKTALIGGKRVWKNNIRVEAFGTVDELNAGLGVAKQFLSRTGRKNLEYVQNRLFTMGSALASPKIDPRFQIGEEEVERLESWIGALEKKETTSGFVLPGNTLASGFLDSARTVARRAERAVVALSRKEEVSPGMLKFLNRLSDYLFLLARSCERKPSARGKIPHASF